jgi:hypothetical protein
MDEDVAVRDLDMTMEVVGVADSYNSGSHGKSILARLPEWGRK